VWRKIKKRLLISSLIFSLTYFSVILFFYKSEFIRGIAEFNFGQIFLALILVVSVWVIRFYKWNLCLNRLGIKISAKISAIIFLSGFSLNFTPGKIGDFVKILLVDKFHKGNKKNIFFVIFLERLTEIFSLAFLLLLISLKHFNLIEANLMIVLFIAMFLLLLFNKKIYSYLILKIFNRSKNKIAGISKDEINSTLYQKLFDKVFLIKINLITIISWILEGYSFYILFYKFVDCEFILIIGIYFLSILIGSVSMLPGGVFTTEAGLVFMLKKIGLKGFEFSPVIIISRFFTLWLPTLIGIFFLIMFKRKYGEIE